MKCLVAPLMLACVLLPAALLAQTDSARARLEALARPVAIVADFTENRYTPLKKKPVIVSGVARLDRTRGLSLDYHQPGAPLVILDARGLLLRHPDGREQTAPPEATDDLRLLHALFAFDLAALEATYEITASHLESADTWTVCCVRRPGASAAYRELSLTGSGSRLTRILLSKTPNLRTEITLSAPLTPESFTPTELARYFR